MAATTTERTMNLTRMTNGKHLLTLVNGKKVDQYVVTPLASDFGTAFTLGRSSPDGCSEEYHVCIDANDNHCDCLGFQHRGMNTKDGRGCKHVAALTRLIQLGKL